MEAKHNSINSSEKPLFNIKQTTEKMSISDVYYDTFSSHLNPFYLYTAHFNYIPNFVEEIYINCEKLSNFIAKEYKLEIKESYYSKHYFRRSKEPKTSTLYSFLFDDVMLYFDMCLDRVFVLFKKTYPSKIESLLGKIRTFKKRKKKNKPSISLLVNTPNGINTKSMEITKPKLNIEDNYNDDFVDVHRTIYKKLSQKNGKGIVLLHGKPGTGKTSYIRYLAATLKKEIIFLPPTMAGEITNPYLVSTLINNPNSIFVIEDAENIVIDRGHEGQSPVSAILNISDGLLSDCLNIQIICSFNTDISKIDSALMRKGRLIGKYEFKELDIPKAQLLSNKLGFNKEINQPMTLTSIYHLGEKEFEQKNNIKSIGFQKEYNTCLA
ncbi:MAG: AAA family ATPase [Flavobacteriales bacterium]|nr:AAA family ATPase [Flavobacteriales bacterium]